VPRDDKKVALGAVAADQIAAFLLAMAVLLVHCQPRGQIFVLFAAWIASATTLNVGQVWMRDCLSVKSNINIEPEVDEKWRMP
jgi:hypothetical protein